MINKNKKKNNIINLSSKEYSDSIAFNDIRFPVFHIHFKEFKDGQYKIVGIHSKKARGEMARFIACNDISNIKDLKL